MIRIAYRYTCLSLPAFALPAFAADYLNKWRVAVMIIFVLAMFLTPADPISMMLLAVPLSLLYFLGIGMCKWMPRSENPFGDDAVTPAST